MRITSTDNICWIAIQPGGGKNGYSGFEVVAHVDIGHGRFDARNMDIHFLNLEEFVRELDQFITDRKHAPRLNGTYDTHIAFSPSGNSVVCEYCLGDAFSSRRTARFFQSGEFEIEQEQLLKLLLDFQELLAQQRY